MYKQVLNLMHKSRVLECSASCRTKTVKSQIQIMHNFIGFAHAYINCFSYPDMIVLVRDGMKGEGNVHLR